MTEWYRQAFGAAYLELYAHRDQQEALENARALTALLSPDPDEPILDLCCGAGRYLCALRQLGYRRLYGLDLSERLLDVAAEALAQLRGEERCQVELVSADMRCIPFADHFGLVLSLFTSFGYFDSDAENRAVLEGVYRTLKPGGVFVLDHMNRPFVLTHLRPSDEQILHGRRVLTERRLTPDGRRVEKRATVCDAGGCTQVLFESVRLYTHEELRTTLQEIGFVDLAFYGSFRGEPLNADSPRMLIIARKPKEPA